MKGNKNVALTTCVMPLQMLYLLYRTEKTERSGIGDGMREDEIERSAYTTARIVAADALSSASCAKHRAEDAGQSHDALFGVAAVEGLVVRASVLRTNTSVIRQR